MEWGTVTLVGQDETVVPLSRQFTNPVVVVKAATQKQAGLGNFGVTTMQIVIPLVMTFGLFGGQSQTLINTSGTLIGKIPAGTETYIHNAGYVWLVLLIPLAFAGFFGMNNITNDTVSRITSYNVCYTKLLRAATARRSRRCG